MLSEQIVTARKVRNRRLSLGLSQREVARKLGCSQAYVYQVEFGRRPLSCEKAGLLEALLGVKRGAFTLEVRQGRPRLTGGGRRVLQELRSSRGLPPSVSADGVKPTNPRSDWGIALENPFYPMAIHLHPRAAEQVRALEARRGRGDNFWRLANSLRFDGWHEKWLVVQVGEICLELAGISLGGVGCSLTSVCGKTGRDTSRQPYPAFLLEHAGASLAWFPQRCVRTAYGHRWPDSILVVARGGRKVTVIVELDGPTYHRNKLREQRRDSELGVAVLHVHPDVLRTESGLRNILDWACSKLP